MIINMPYSFSLKVYLYIHIYSRCSVQHCCYNCNTITSNNYFFPFSC